MDVDNRIDREEEKRIERKKQENRHQLESKMQKEGMKTFEAKLSEKSAKEVTDHEQKNLMQEHGKEKSQTEQQSAVDKIISKATQETDEQSQAKQTAVTHQNEDKFADKQERIKEKHFEPKKDSDEARSQNVDKKGSGELSSEGHKRVAEKEDGQGGGSGSGSQNMSDDSSDQSGYGKDKDSSKDGALEGQDSSYALKFKRFDGSNLEGGFDPSARNFEQQDLDEIVSQVEYGVNELGEQHFTVSLNDEYYDGLKVSALRTDEGVVVQFACPNVAVRSTFLKYRMKLYKHFAVKDIDVFRIDVY
jgi:hypothetical protein